MTRAHEAFVSARFDAVASRFKTSVAPDDFRLAAICRALHPIAGKSVLDLGCGKGRFARALHERGACTVGLDASARMLGEAHGLARVRASAARLPFPHATFDAVVAIEVFEHLHRRALDAALAEMARVLRPGGRAAIVDKNAAALDARRPWLPRAFLKRIDEYRGRWMYRPGEPVRERWFAPRSFRSSLKSCFESIQIRYLLSPEESRRVLFRRIPPVRQFVLWTGIAPGGGNA
jgi:ubiquinone/menaquinone biosynthesis C-methylase UbiE